MRLSVLVPCAILGICLGTELERKLQTFVHGHSLGHLRQEERVLMAQLIATAERYELEEFLDLVGVQPVMELLTDLPRHLASDFMDYLSQVNISHVGRGRLYLLSQFPQHCVNPYIGAEP